MPVYLVRWPEPVVSLVSAHDEEELKYRLDEAADPGGCTWQVYKGPLWVDFELPVKVDISAHKDKRRPLSPEDVDVELDWQEHTPWDLVPIEPQAVDTPGEMYDRIRRFAFPTLQRLMENAPDGELEAIDAEAVKAAVLDDMQPLIEYTWRQAQLEARDDPEAEIMRQMGITVKFGALNQPSEDDGCREPDDE